MAKLKVKKFFLIVSREHFDSVLCDLIRMECVDVFTPGEVFDDPELAQIVTRETMDLTVYGAGSETITLIGTHCTLTLAGWLSVKHEQALAAMLSGYTCAWDISVPDKDEIPNVPVILSFPRLFTKHRMKGRKLFTPLSGRGSNAGIPKNDCETEAGSL